MLKAEKLHRTVPVSSVPAVRCASGAQCSPALTAAPRAASASPSSSQSQPSARKLSTAVCESSSGQKNTSTPGIPASRAANCRVSRRSWAAIRSVPRAFTKRSPSSSPAMPGILCVPGSNRSGSWSGMTCKSDCDPVPPRRSGSGSMPHSSSPVPCGPYSPLCPGMAMNAAPSAAMSTGSVPADWEASMIRGTPFSRHSWATCSMGRI